MSKNTQHDSNGPNTTSQSGSSSSRSGPGKNCEGHYKFAAANWESSVSVRTSVEKKAGPTLNICPTKWKDQDQQWQQQHQLLVTIMTNRSLLKVKK